MTILFLNWIFKKDGKRAYNFHGEIKNESTRPTKIPFFVNGASITSSKKFANTFIEYFSDSLIRQYVESATKIAFSDAKFLGLASQKELPQVAYFSTYI